MFGDRYTEEEDLIPIIEAVEGATQHLDPDGFCVARVVLEELLDDQSLLIDVSETGIDIKHFIMDDGFLMSEHYFDEFDPTPENYRKAVDIVRKYATAAGLSEDNFDDYNHRVCYYSGNEMALTSEEITP